MPLPARPATIKPVEKPKGDGALQRKHRAGEQAGEAHDEQAADAHELHRLKQHTQPIGWPHHPDQGLDEQHRDAAQPFDGVEYALSDGFDEGLDLPHGPRCVASLDGPCQRRPCRLPTFARRC
jgi:hypothetical protein